jgi:Family of unknown function (DUF6941)
MPKPYVFVICEKVVVDAMGTASLIALFNEITVQVPVDQEIPPTAAVPKEWAIFVSWEAADGDQIGNEYNQSVQVVYPDGTVFVEKRDIKFVLQDDKRHQNTIQMQGFPMGQQGRYEIKIWLDIEGAIVFPPQSIYFRVVWQKPSKAVS